MYVYQLVTELTPVQQHLLLHHMAPCVQLLVHMMNKIKLEASGPVNKCYKACYEVHTDMAGGDSVAIYTWSSTCLLLHLEFHV